MQLTVDLEKQISFSIIGVILFFILIFGLIIYFIVKVFMKHKNKEKKVIITKDILKIKKKYLYQIDTISNEININKIKERTAYNKLSKLIRNFVLEVTDIDLLKSTLSEIKKKDTGNLYELIKDYYEPEFSKNNKGDISSSINKTKKVIKEWK